MTAPPRVIAMDIGFFEPAADDAQLAAAIDTRAGAAAGHGRHPGDRWRRRRHAWSDGSVAFATGLAAESDPERRPDIGATDVLPDDRGVVRSMPLLPDIGGTQRPSLGLLAAARYLRRPTFIDGRPDSRHLRAGRASDPGRCVQHGAHQLLRAAFRSRAPTTTFHTVSFVDVLRGQADPATWRDGIAFIGLIGAAGFADDYWTPVSEQGHKMAGVEIHANVAATLLSTQFLRSAPLALDLAVILADRPRRSRWSPPTSARWRRLSPAWA